MEDDEVEQISEFVTLIKFMMGDRSNAFRKSVVEQALGGVYVGKGELDLLQRHVTDIDNTARHHSVSLSNGGFPIGALAGQQILGDLVRISKIAAIMRRELGKK